MAILTEAIHSGIDLIASCIAYFSVRQAEEPADAGHRYGHEKFENVAAAAEGVLILVGAGVIVYASAHSLVKGPELESLGFGIAVVGFASLVNLLVSAGCSAARAETESAGAGGRRGAPAHRRLHVARRARRPRARALDGAGVAGPGGRAGDRGRDRGHGPQARQRARGACWSTRPCPPTSSRRSAQAIQDFRDRDVVGYHQLRTRRAGARRYVDLHVQFRAGTTLEDAHAIAHELQDRIASRLRGADVLIHLEPEDKVREDPIGEPRRWSRPSRRRRRQRRLIPAASATANTTPA